MDHIHQSARVVFPEIASSWRALHVCRCGRAGRRRMLIGPIIWDRFYHEFK